MALNQFEDLGVSKGLCKILAHNGYDTPTDIQKLAIPPIAAGQDVIGVAPTGTGKTLAYLLPILQYVRKTKVNIAKGPLALVVAPSRELAVQVAKVAELLAEDDENCRVACVFGGAGIVAQRQALAGHPSIVVGTPGRIRDLYSSQDLVLTAVKFLVLDEADRLMDMGFTPQLRAMLEVLPLKRQTLLFSATFNTRVETASADFLEWPVKVQAAKQATVPTTIAEQFIAANNRATKLALLADIVEGSQEISSGFVFCKTRQEANGICAFLVERGLVAQVLHANKGQNTRQAALDAFKAGTIHWLVTTDVASRGLDVVALPMVIQFGLPVDIRDYIHRTGRTGRAGVPGKSLTLIDPADQTRVPQLQKLVGKTITLAPTPSGLEVAITPREELIEYERAKDDIRKALDPTFKGAFHEKRKVFKGLEKPVAKSKSKTDGIKTSIIKGKPKPGSPNRLLKSRGRKYK
jgi:ATP-dependent RNA helicase RhlE